MTETPRPAQWEVTRIKGYIMLSPMASERKKWDRRVSKWEKRQKQEYEWKNEMTAQKQNILTYMYTVVVNLFLSTDYGQIHLSDPD